MITHFFKQFLKPTGKLYKLLSFIYNYRQKKYLPQKIESINPILENISKYQQKIRFIQVGSNDGISGDPLYKYIKAYDWYGVLVEPVPFLFERLKKNYEGAEDKLRFLNIAVSADDDTYKTLYCVDEQYRDNLPSWYFQLASFKKEVLFHHDIDNLDTYIKSIRVPALLMQKVIDEYMNGNIDLLHIDTEGYDFEILKNLDFKKTIPQIILVEYIHLNVADRIKMIGLLKSQQYKVYRCDNDLMCLHSSVSKLYMGGTKKFSRIDTT